MGCDDEDEPVFWFALALAEGEKGRLSDFVKDKAIWLINQGGDLERWDTADNQKNYKKRKKVIEDLYEKFLTEKFSSHSCPVVL